MSQVTLDSLAVAIAALSAKVDALATRQDVVNASAAVAQMAVIKHVPESIYPRVDPIAGAPTWQEVAATMTPEQGRALVLNFLAGAMTPQSGGGQDHSARDAAEASRWINGNFAVNSPELQDEAAKAYVGHANTLIRSGIREIGLIGGPKSAVYRYVDEADQLRLDKPWLAQSYQGPVRDMLNRMMGW